MSTAAGPTVSVVIPVKDDAEPLRRCLRALALQSHPVDEVVVVDNASVDDSAVVARDAGARVVRCDTPGIPAASAHGYDHARGDLVLRLDADCVPARTWVAAMVAAFDASPTTAAFTGGARFIDGPRMLRAPLAAVYLAAYTAIAVTALGHLPLFGSNLGMRRDAWHQVRTRVHRHDAEVHDDFDLAFHLGERHRIGFAPHAAMGMSMRPFMSLPGFARRTYRGVRTIAVHWPNDLPPLRWTRRAVRYAVMRRRSRRARAARRDRSAAVTGRDEGVSGCFALP